MDVSFQIQEVAAMMLFENIREAYNSLVINKKRSFLTMIGIVIGLSSVLFITSIGDTLISLFDNYMVQMLYKGVTVQALSGYTETDGLLGERDDYSFTLDEIYDFIDSTDGLILDINPMGGGEMNGTVNVDSVHKANVSVNGVSSSYETTGNVRMIAGRFVSKDDCRHFRPSAVISDIAAEKCFGSVENALGKNIDITYIESVLTGVDVENMQYIYDESAHTVSVVVTGVYEYVETSMGAIDSLMLMTSKAAKDSTPLYCCYSYLRQSNGQDMNILRGMMFNVRDRESVNAARNVIADFLEDKYGDNPSYGYDMYDSVEDMAIIKRLLKVVTYAFSLIGGISLLVGGIVLMNTMLISVTERTKEIGIKKALGAKTSTIRAQFLTESAMLCLASCAIGVFFGFFFGLLIETNMDKITAMVSNEGLRYFLENSNVHVTPSLGSIIFCSLFSVVVGVVFGLYPANKGAKMQPVDALRYE